jgi:succinate-acetate transporter protein
MSSDVEIAGIEAETAAAAPDTANPALLGVPCAVIGVSALGLFLLGYAPAGSAGAVVPLFAALGIGLFVAARWAIALGVGPFASIFALFGAFYFSFALLYVGFVHNWYGTAPPNASAGTTATALTDTFSVFALCWAIGTTALVLASLRLPLSVFLVLLFSDLVFIFVWLAFVSGTFASIGVLRVLAGASCFGAVIPGGYIFYASLTAALGARPLPLGRAVRS